MLTPSKVTLAQFQVMDWLRGMPGKAPSIKDDDTTWNTAKEIVTRFLSHVEPAGFSLSLLATGSLTEPRFVGNWRWHDHVVKLPTMLDAPNRDEARLLACASLLHDRFFRQILLQHPLSEAA